MKLFKMLSTTLAVTLLAGSVMSTAAQAALVAPEGAALRLRNHDQGSCPADGTVRVFVTAKQEGTVHVRFQRKSDGAYFGPMVMTVKKNPTYGKNGVWKNHKYLAKMEWHPTFGAPTHEKYRVIASGGGKMKTSGWTPLIVKC